MRSSHKWIEAILSCGKHNTTMQTWLVSRLRLCGRPWGLKSTSGWVLWKFARRTFVPRIWATVKSGVRTHQYTLFSRWVSVVHFRRQRSCHQDDCQRTKSDNETCFADPQSCAWLVVRQDKFGAKGPNQICWHRKPTCWHADHGQFHAWWMGPSDKRSKIPCRKFFLKTRHVNVGIFLCVKTSSLRPDAKMEEDVSSDMLRPRRRPAKSQRKVVRKDQLHYLRSLHKCVVHLKILIRESLFRREEQKKGSKRAVKFSKGTWHQLKNREREGPSWGIIQKCEPHERSPCAPKLGERSHEETLHQERCARRAAWDIFTSSRMRTKLRFVLLLQHG